MTKEKAIDMLHRMRADNLNLDDSYTKDKYDALGMAIEALEAEPVNPIKTGHWIKMPIGFKCSNCNELEDKTTKYCPNCGCRMVDPQERIEE